MSQTSQSKTFGQGVNTSKRTVSKKLRAQGQFSRKKKKSRKKIKRFKFVCVCFFNFIYKRFIVCHGRGHTKCSGSCNLQ